MARFCLALPATENMNLLVCRFGSTATSVIVELPAGGLFAPFGDVDSVAYSIACPCGNELEVTAAQAGAQIVCACGRPVRVPRLSQLRQMAGRAAYEAGIIDTVHRMIRERELPWGNTCAISGLPTTDTYELYVECDSTWVKTSGAGRYVFRVLIFFFWPFRIIGLLLGDALLGEDRQEFGRDRGLYVPLRVRKEHHKRLRRTTSQAKLRKLLRGVPIYARLLDELPDARIIA